MEILIEDDVFAEDNHQLAIAMLWWHGSEQRHIVDVDNALSTPHFDAWYESLTQVLQEQIDVAREWATEQQANFPVRLRSIRVVACSSDEDLTATQPSVTPDTAGLLVARPLYLLVEDALNDGNFLRSIAPEGWSEYLEDYIQRGLIELQHAGGISNMARLVEQVLEMASRERFIFRLRTWVMSDSDARDSCSHADRNAHCAEDERPSCAPSDAVCRVAQGCEDAGFTHHILTRRAIENYVPMKALKAYCKNRTLFRRDKRQQLCEKYEVFSGFRAEQRHYFHMKDGFSGSNIEQLDHLFADVSGSAKEVFADGGFVGKTGLDKFVYGEEYRTRPGVDLQSWFDEDAQQEAEEIMRSIFKEV